MSAPRSPAREIAPERSWGFDVAGSLTARDGYPLPYCHSKPGSDGRVRDVQVTEAVTDFRLDDLYLLNLRVQKELRFSDLAITFSADVFDDGVLTGLHLAERRLVPTVY